jgi:hypothetical protein
MPSLGVSSLDLAACGNASGLLFRSIFRCRYLALICRLVAGACWHRPRGGSDSVPKAPDPGRALKTPITAGLLNDRVVPFFDEKEVKLSRVLTGRDTGYCGNPEHHEYELCLAVEDIDHFRTKTKSPQTNGIAERFHKTVLDEFYRIAFRKRLFASIEDLQDGLDLWVQKLQQGETASRPLVLRQDAAANIP